MALRKDELKACAFKEAVIYCASKAHELFKYFRRGSASALVEQVHNEGRVV